MAASPSSPRLEKIERSYLCRVLRLAPEVVEVILDGRQPEGVTLRGLMKGFPVEWERNDQELQSARNGRA